MSRENPLWGAPRIHGELLMPGVSAQPSADIWSGAADPVPRLEDFPSVIMPLGAPRQSFLFVATIIFVGCLQVKRSLPSDNIEGGRSDILIWPTPG
jgi:hypothetical protein